MTILCLFVSCNWILSSFGKLTAGSIAIGLELIFEEALQDLILFSVAHLWHVIFTYILTLFFITGYKNDSRLQLLEKLKTLISKWDNTSSIQKWGKKLKYFIIHTIFLGNYYATIQQTLELEVDFL